MFLSYLNLQCPDALRVGGSILDEVLSCLLYELCLSVVNCNLLFIRLVLGAVAICLLEVSIHVCAHWNLMQFPLKFSTTTNITLLFLFELRAVQPHFILKDVVLIVKLNHSHVVLLVCYFISVLIFYCIDNIWVLFDAFEFRSVACIALNITFPFTVV